jgi:putative tricarboxylic transport membrane protein
MANAPADKTAFFTAVAAAGLPLITMKYLGFPVTAALSFALIARAFGSRRLPLDLAIGLILALIAYYGFTRLGVGLGAILPILGR